MIRKERIQISFPIPNYTKETDQQTQTWNEKIQISFPMLNYSNLILMSCQPHRVTSGAVTQRRKGRIQISFPTQNSKETNRHRQGHTDRTRTTTYQLMVLDASCTLSLHVSMILVFYQAVQDLVSFCFIVQLILKQTDK